MRDKWCIDNILKAEARGVPVIGICRGSQMLGVYNGKRGFAIWDEGRKRLIHTPRDAEFLRAYLKKTDESWKTLALTGWARTKREAFFYDGKLWRHAAPGSIVFGWVIGVELSMETIGVE